MSEPFDPYYTWLAIPPEEQPPNHYRLLGLRLFESNVEVIEHAADQRMAHLRSIQTGKHAAAVQKLLNELAGARVCLLSATKRAAYDRQLREQAALASPGLVVPASAGFVVPASAGGTSPDGHPKAALQHAARRSPRRAYIVVGACCLVAIVTGLAVRAYRSRQPVPDAKQVAANEPEQRGRAEEEHVPPATPPKLPAERPPPAKPATVDDTRPTAPVEQPKPPAKPPTEPPTEPPAKPPVEPPQEPVEPPGKPPGEPPAPKAENPIVAEPKQPPVEPPPPEKTEPPKLPVGEAPKGESPALVEPKPGQFPTEPPAKREPVPNDAAQKEVLKQIEEVYKVSAAKTSDAKGELARDLLDLGKKPTQNPAEKFVLLRKAIQLASDAGDVPLMLEAIDEAGVAFELDALESKIRLLSKLVAAAFEPARIKALIESAEPVLAQAMSDDRYDQALVLAEAIFKTCQKPQARMFRKYALDRRTEIQKRSDQWTQMQRIFDTLKKQPDDPAANLTAGQWHCYLKGDWAKGLPHFARCGDKTLKTLAEQELRQPTEAADQAKLGDGWWDAGHALTGVSRDALLLHAAQWYEQAQPGLNSPLLEAKIKKRLEEISTLKGPNAWRH